MAIYGYISPYMATYTWLYMSIYDHYHGRQLESAVRDWTAGPKLDHWTEVEVDWTYINIIVSIYGHIYDHIWSYMDIYSL